MIQSLPTLTKKNVFPPSSKRQIPNDAFNFTQDNEIIFRETVHFTGSYFSHDDCDIRRDVSDNIFSMTPSDKTNGHVKLSGTSSVAGR